MNNKANPTSVDEKGEDKFEELFRDESTEELLQGEIDDLVHIAYRSYIESRDCTAKEAFVLQNKIEGDPKLKYEAIRLFNRKLRLLFGIVKKPLRDDLRPEELLRAVDRLAAVEDEKTFDECFRKLIGEKGDR